MRKTYLTLASVVFSCTLISQVTVNPVLDTQKLAILPFDYAQDGTETPLSDIETGFFTSSNSMKAFYEEASYGKMTLDGTVYPYRTNQPPLFGIGYTNCYPVDSVIANQPDVDYSVIDNIILFPHDTVSKSCGAGLSSSEKLPFTTPDGQLEFRRSGFRTEFYFPSDFSNTTSSTIAHELMHSFGNGFHSNSYIKENGEWKVQGYGNVFDILGLRSQASHPCSMLKHKLGWLTDNEIETVVESDTFRIYALEQNLPGQTQSLIIELPNQVDLQPNDTFKFDRLYLEYRGLTGFDSRTALQRRVRLNDNTYYPNDNPHGLSIIGVDCESMDECLPMLIDMHPDPIGGVGASYLPHEASDAPLKLNETYDVDNNQISMEVVNVSEGNYIDVYISMPSNTGTKSLKSNDIKVYPTPVKNILNIEGHEGRVAVKVYDMYGKLVVSDVVNSSMDLTELANGMYILVMEDLSTKEQTQKRIIKN
jgi:hypothetical protein